MREFTDGMGVVWKAEVVSHGRTSGYLNPKVHRPLVQFTCVSKPVPNRYVGLPVKTGSIEELGDEQLVKLLAKAESH